VTEKDNEKLHREQATDALRASVRLYAVWARCPEAVVMARALVPAVELSAASSWSSLGAARIERALNG
jgi:hypothetical protein